MVKQYVGARYVPKFASPVEWASDTSYEALTIVTFNNASYTSKIPVPPTVGNPANNPQYWALTGNYNAQVEEYRQEVNKAIGNYTYTPVNSLNIDNTGVTDCADILAGVTTNCGLKVGTYAIRKNCEINAQIVIPNGAILNIANGVTVTFKKGITAGRYPIFSGTGTIGLSAGIGYPEWFGAVANDINVDSLSALNKCYAAFNTISLDNGCYYISDTFTMGRDSTSIIGVNTTDQTTSRDRVSSIAITKSTGVGVLIGTSTFPGSINAMPRNITMRDITIVRTVTPGSYDDSIGIAVWYALYPKIIRCSTVEHSTGIEIKGSVHSLIENCNTFLTSVPTIKGAYGILLLNDVNINSAGGNASSYIINASLALGGTISDSYAIRAYGDYGPADLYIDKAESVGFTTGVDITGVGSDLYKNEDIYIINSVFDGVKGHGVVLRNCSPATITIDNVYIAPNTNNDASAPATYGVLAINCKGVSITNCNIVLFLNHHSYGIWFEQCDNCVSSNNKIIGGGYGGFGTVVSASSNIKINNVFEQGGLASDDSKAIFLQNCNHIYVNSAVEGGTAIITTSLENSEINKTMMNGNININGTPVSAPGTQGTVLISGV